ncbi:putative glycosyltransferase, TIGR04372 family [Tistlia consotensis USBA 355]|uniref:Putative glycosyltransferase, TIGR04372 family n=1 Tax=Tistlia consotensis USBA 355 TaxID=560819 RepID=A0A1Y6BE09_9PROT|nr:putative glycosyltransferase, TIGR04372 family [Tistlia consotensis USBA 355]
MPWERALRLSRRPLLVFRPAGKYFGHLNLEVMQAAATARRNDAWLYLVEPPNLPNRTCFDLVMPGVRRLPSCRLLDRVLNWYADRDLLRQEQAHLAEQQLSRDPDRRLQQRLRRKIGLPVDGEWLEKEYRLRIALRIRGLQCKQRRLARRKERLMAARSKARTAARTGGGRDKDKAAKAESVERKDELRQVRHELKRVEQLLAEHQGEFAKVCREHPLDPSRFWTWPLHQWRIRRRERQEQAPARHARMLVAGQGESYYRRRLVAETQPMHLRKADEQRLAALAERLGIPPDARIVALHIREPGYKSGNKSAAILPDGTVVLPRNESTRNNTVDNYLPAIRYLTEAGYTVVRLGDRFMTPLSLPSVVDIATNPESVPALDYYCIARSVFFLASDSGPMIIPFMTGTPMLLVNATHIAVNWPIGPADLLVPKYVCEAESGRFLSLEETCGRHHLDHFRADALYDYIELTPEDLLAGVREMERRLQSPGPPGRTELQARYRKAVVQWMDQPNAPNYFRKWAADGGFIGNGDLAQFVVERDAEGGGWRPLERSGEAPAEARRGSPMAISECDDDGAGCP